MARKQDTDEDQGEAESVVTADDYEFMQLEKMRSAIATSGIGGKVRCKIVRKLDNGSDVILPTMHLDSDELADYQDAIHSKHGGGNFSVQFRAPNGQILSQTSFALDGAPKRHDATEKAAAPAALSAGPTPRELALEAIVKQLQEDASRRVAADQKREERESLAAMVAAAVAPLAAEIKSVARSAAPVETPKPLSPFEEIVIKRLQREDKNEVEGREPAYVTALKTQVEAMAKNLEAAEKARVEAEARRREEEHKAEVADLREQVEELAAMAAAPRAKNPALEGLLETVATVGALDKIMNAGREPAERDNVFGDFMRQHGKKIVAPLLEFVGTKTDQIAGALSATTTPTTPPPTPGVAAPPEDKNGFCLWLQGQWQAKPPLSAMRDPEQIHATLKKFPQSLTALAAVRERRAAQGLPEEPGRLPVGHGRHGRERRVLGGNGAAPRRAPRDARRARQGGEGRGAEAGARSGSGSARERPGRR